MSLTRLHMPQMSSSLIAAVSSYSPSLIVTIASVITGLAPRGPPTYREKTAEKAESSAGIYGKFLVRYQNKYIPPQGSIIWYSKLAK